MARIDAGSAEIIHRYKSQGLRGAELTSKLRRHVALLRVLDEEAAEALEVSRPSVVDRSAYEREQKHRFEANKNRAERDARLAVARAAARKVARKAQAKAILAWL